MLRADVVHVRKQVFALRLAYRIALSPDAEKVMEGEDDAMDKCGSSYIHVLEKLNMLLRDGYIDAEKNNVGKRQPQTLVVRTDGSTDVNIEFTAAPVDRTDNNNNNNNNFNNDQQSQISPRPRPAEIVTIPLSEKALQCLADLLSCDKDVYCNIECSEVQALVSSIIE